MIDVDAPFSDASHLFWLKVRFTRYQDQLKLSDHDESDTVTDVSFAVLIYGDQRRVYAKYPLWFTDRRRNDWFLFLYKK